MKDWLKREKACWLCLSLLLVRSIERLWRADIWGEDAFFLGDALTLGARSLLIPYAGSFHTIQRLVAWGVVATRPPATWAAVIYFVSVVLMAFVASRFASTEYRWLLPNDKHRLYACLLICVAPGLNEMLGNLCNLNWIFVFWLAFLFLRPLETNLSRKEFVAALLVLLSVGTSFSLLPLLIARMVLKRQRHLTMGYEALFAAAIAVYSLALYALSPYLATMGDSYFLGMGAPPPTLSNFPALASLATLKVILRGLLVRPWLGSGFTLNLVDRMQSTALIVLFCFIAAALIYYWARSENRTRLLMLAAFAFGISLWPLAAIVARPPALSALLYGEYWHYRYAFPTGFVAVVLWLCALKDKRLVGLFLILNIAHGLDRFPIRAYSGTFNHIEEPWSARARVIDQFQASSTPEAISVPTYPTGWKLSAKRT